MNPSSQTVSIKAVWLLVPLRIRIIERIKHLYRFKTLRRYIHWAHNSVIFDGIETGLPMSIEPRNSHDIFIPDVKIR